eukprot:evm.model.scf_2792.1 EVM.evm.TU.scf_2792.1   scf_2792:2645-3972(-)
MFCNRSVTNTCCLFVCVLPGYGEMVKSVFEQAHQSMTKHPVGDVGHCSHPRIYGHRLNSHCACHCTRLKDEMMREGKGARQYHEVGRDEVQEQGQEEEDVEEQEEEEEEEEQDVAMEEDGISAPQDCKGQEPKTGNEDVSTNAMETDDDRPQASASVAEEHQIIHSCAAPTEDEGKDLEGDFLRLMKERFLAGEDSAFINYAAID